MVRALDGNAMMLVHGNTAHGVQNLGSPKREIMVTTNYVPLSGVGLGMAASGTNQWWPMKPTGAAAWTDDHSNILPLINWRG